MKALRDAVILLLWGAFILWIAATGQLSNYLHPSLQRFTIAGGVALLILAFFAFRGIFSNTSASSPCCHDHHEGHVQPPSSCRHHGEHEHEEEHHHVPSHESSHDGHSHESCGHDHEQEEIPAGHSHGDGSVSFSSFLFKTGMLIVPLMVILLGQGNRFTLSTVRNRGVVDNLQNLPSARASTESKASKADDAVQSGSASTNPPSISGGSMPIQVIDLLYAVQMPSYREEFEGKEVELIGQYVPMTTGNPKGDRFQAIRMFITCCAADAKPVGVTIQYPKTVKISEMGWLKITGKPVFPIESGRRTAILEATKVEECPAPDEPFVY